MCPAGEKWKKEEVLRHSDAILGLALRAAVAVSGYGCLVCVGKCEQQELQEKVVFLVFPRWEQREVSASGFQWS